MKADPAVVPDIAQGELKPTLRTQGYFMACQWFPSESVEIEHATESSIFTPAIVAGSELLSPHVMEIKLSTAAPIYYHAGQFINLKRSDGLVRSYSLASCPWRDESLQLHVRRMLNGRMSNWIHDEVEVGEQLEIQGPYGHCFYASGKEDQPILMIGTGTGAGALWAIAQDAMHTGHRGDIFFYHGVHRSVDLYLHTELTLAAAKNPSFHYRGCVSGPDVIEGCLDARADRQALMDFTDMTGMRVLLCGQPDMVKSARKHAYLAGASLDDILVDPFEMADLRRQPRAGTDQH